MSAIHRPLSICALALAALVVLAAACAGDDGSAGTPPEPLRVGLLLNFSGESGRAADRARGFDLAIKHVNEAGGVFGQPVETVRADSTLDPEVAAAEAQRLIEEEGVHALVGPSTSANSLVVIEKATRPLNIPTISPSATSPLLTGADDGDFFFRTALSDVAQGPVLARVTRERGFDNVGLIYRNDAWGQGLADSFMGAWTGAISFVSIEPGAPTHLPELEWMAAEGTQALVVIAFNTEGVTIMREASDNGLYDRFALGDALVGAEVLSGLGGDFDGEMWGTTADAPTGSASEQTWEAAYIEEYGALPESAYVKAAYDATIALALAAQSAGSFDGAAIRDHLRIVGAAPGVEAIAGATGVSAALSALRDGEAIDYDGASTTLDWDANGDLTGGHIGVWRYSKATGIEHLEVVAYEN